MNSFSALFRCGMTRTSWLDQLFQAGHASR